MHWPIMRQTFSELSIVLNKYKYINNISEKPDFILSFGSESNESLNLVERSKRILILMENPSIWMPDDDYIAKFGIIISPFPIKNHQNRNIISQAAVPWFYGINFETNVGLSHNPINKNYLTLNELSEMRIPEKNKLLSFVVSGKNMTKGHAWRIELALELKKYFNNEIDIFGFGWNPISDKKNAIDPYLYSIAIENTSDEHYWTEKISDVMLGFTNPIYAGATNINKYFDQSISEIKYGIAPKEFVKKVAKIINKIPDKYSILNNREKILYEYNLFYYVAKIIEEEILA